MFASANSVSTKQRGDTRTKCAPLSLQAGSIRAGRDWTLCPSSTRSTCRRSTCCWSRTSTSTTLRACRTSRRRPREPSRRRQTVNPSERPRGRRLTLFSQRRSNEAQLQRADLHDASDQGRDARAALGLHPALAGVRRPFFENESWGLSVGVDWCRGSRVCDRQWSGKPSRTCSERRSNSRSRCQIGNEGNLDLLGRFAKRTSRPVVGRSLLPADDGRGGTSSNLYDEADLCNCCDKVELVDFHQVVEHNGVPVAAPFSRGLGPASQTDERFSKTLPPLLLLLSREGCFGARGARDERGKERDTSLFRLSLSAGRLCEIFAASRWLSHGKHFSSQKSDPVLVLQRGTRAWRGHARDSVQPRYRFRILVGV